MKAQMTGRLFIFFNSFRFDVGVVRWQAPMEADTARSSRRQRPVVEKGSTAAYSWLRWVIVASEMDWTLELQYRG